NPAELLSEHRADALQRLLPARPLPEQTNLADLPQYSDQLLQLRQLLTSEMQRLNDPAAGEF
ncbi:MAG: hypothetical protein ACKPJJ_11475, partial [Planctomycetaceae bacterium]